MPVRLNDEQCLLWIKDPSISPFVNNQDISGYRKRKYRKDILVQFDVDAVNALENPKSFLNKVKRKCFYNSALRQKIVDQIKEYQRDGTLRLYTLNDKITDTIEYITPPFKEEECKRWANNHLVNPRTNEKIIMANSVYIELVYTTLQYGLPLPSILDTEPTEKYEKTLHKIIHKIVENVMIRLQFMKDTDEYFLKHDVGSFDKKLKIESSISPIRKAATKQKNTFSVSSLSSNKSLNSADRRVLRDIMLENMEEKKLAAEYQYKKGLLPKKEIDKTIFDAFKQFLRVLQNEVMNGNELINNILKDDTSDNAKSRIIGSINSYLKKKYNETSLKTFLNNNKLDTIEGIISNFINNIYIQLIDPSIVIHPHMEIGLLSTRNKLVHFKDSKIIKQITSELETFIKQYFFVGNYKIKKYFMDLVEDKIPQDLIDKKLNYLTYPPKEHKNYYYTILITASSEEPAIMRLPVGQGLLIGKELTKAIIDLDDPNFNSYDEDSVITDDNPLNGFTYEECKNWVILPIINPRTFKRILIDSPMYNRLLCMSYQYDTKLIPRMITMRGYEIIMALSNIMLNILNEGGEEKVPQTREQLENYIINKEAQFAEEKGKKRIVPDKIGLKWKNIGTKHPNGGVEIINKNLKVAFLKSTNQDGGLPFYVSFTEEDFAKFSITDITKNSYIEISTYYIQAIDNKNKTANNLGLRWKIINNERYKEGIKREGVEIINKKLKEKVLKLASKGNVLPARVTFTKDDLWWNFGITTAIAKNRYIKFTYYYKPVYEKNFSDIIIKPKSDVVITNRDPAYVAYKYYTVADCLRWAHQPNRDPKRQDILLNTDGEEYNAIFEQALLYDYNIQPINITPKGIKFMKSVIKTKLKLLTIAEHLKHPTSASVDIKEINSIMCIAINNIYDDETNEEGKKYKKFKDKMKQKCVQYNKEPGVCIKELKDGIKEKFPPNKKHAKEYRMNYYQDSALASLLIQYYDNASGKIYNEELRDIFMHDFNKFYVYIYEIDDELNEFKKDAIDAGGPKREFFTKLFEELFCDDEHPTRPFISPTNIIGNIYCINPNFEPDENFRKVINAYKQNHSPIIDFKTERDYEYIYFVIGKLLCLPVYNELIGLPKQFSSYILAGFIQQPKEIDYYDILYFYLRDFKTTISYINMINNTNIESVEDLDLSFNDIYIISKSKDPYSIVNKGIEPPIPIRAQLPIDLLRYKMLSTTKDAVKNSSNERKLREYDEKWKKQLNEYEIKKEIYDRTSKVQGSKSSSVSYENAVGAKITKKNCIKFILQQSKHVVTRNFLIKKDVNSRKSMKKRYDSLFAGFSNEIRKFLYKKKVTIEQLSLLITNEQLTIEILQELVSKINVYMEIKYTSDSFVGVYTGSRMSDDEQKERGDELKGYMSNIITQKRAGESDEEHLNFVKNLLRFWTGLTYYDKITRPYQICYKYGKGINIKNLPNSHTCTYTLDIFGFPAEYNAEEREKFIYDKFKLAVLEQEMEMH
jgi:hypothetical protein